MCWIEHDIFGLIYFTPMKFTDCGRQSKSLDVLDAHVMEPLLNKQKSANMGNEQKPNGNWIWACLPSGAWMLVRFSNNGPCSKWSLNGKYEYSVLDGWLRKPTGIRWEVFSPCLHFKTSQRLCCKLTFWNSCRFVFCYACLANIFTLQDVQRACKAEWSLMFKRVI